MAESCEGGREGIIPRTSEERERYEEMGSVLVEFISCAGKEDYAP